MMKKKYMKPMIDVISLVADSSIALDSTPTVSNDEFLFDSDDVDNL